MKEKDETSAFPQTPWTWLAEACSTSEDAPKALEALCCTYWQPVYVYFRSRAGNVEDAEDLTQGFFESLLTSESLRKVERARGRLRSFLLTMAKRFQIDEWRRVGTEKRGGTRLQVPLDSVTVEDFFFDGHLQIDDESLFDRSWAYALLTSVSERLRQKYSASGKIQLYEAIKGSLEGDGKYEAGADLAERLGMSHEALRGAVFRLRRQFRECLTEEVQKTCETDDEVREEIAFLCRILAG